MRISKSRFNYDPEASWKKSFSYDSESFTRDWNDFPVEALFPVFMTTAPLLMALSSSFDGPVSCLAFFRAISSFLAATTQFDREGTDVEAVSTVPDSSNLEKLCLNLVVMLENHIVQHTGLSASVAEGDLTAGIIIF